MIAASLFGVVGCLIMNRVETCSVTVAEGGSPFAVEAGSRGFVLFVSDDNNLRAVAGRVLEREGYGVVTAAHAGHALLAALTRERIDFLVCDLTIGDMPGDALATTLKRHHPDVQILYMADTQAVRCDGVVVRPFTGDDLLMQLDAAGAPATSPAS
jgi:CheY-like chemotaxis protein